MTYFDSFRTKFFDKIDKNFENEEIKIEKQEIFFVKFAFFDFFYQKLLLEKWLINKIKGLNKEYT